MTRFVLPALLALFSIAAKAAEQTELNDNLTLFSVMAALDVAGFADPPPNEFPLRATVREAIQKKNLQVVSELKTFVAGHRKPNRGVDLAQYVSFALASSEPPEFQPRFQGLEVPPEVDALEGFQRLMQRFHKDAEIEQFWQRSQTVLEQQLARYQAPVSRAILEVNGYLRNPASGYMGRRFFVYVDLLGPTKQVHTRSYKDDYYIVVTPAAEPQIQEVRHAYLHYLVDPLATKFFAKLERKRGVIDYAQAAPALEQSYKSDFLLLATECLLKAIESRLDRRPQTVQEALLQGFVLTPHFAEHLPAYEKEGASMRLFFPELVDAIDLKKEERRLENVQFASAAAERKPLAESAKAEPSKLSPAENTVEEADKLYTGRELDKARAVYMRALRETEDRTIHVRVYYGLARIAALQRNPELAEQLFRRTLELAPDPYTRSWTEVYLGRLYENSSKPEDAAEHYRTALGVQGAPAGAKQAAEQGLQKLNQKPN